jgi:rhodanese-related sulfurtransferase
VLAGDLPAWQAAGGAVDVGHAAAEPFGLEAARAKVPAVVPGSLGDAVILSVDPSDAYRRRHIAGATWLCRSRLELTVTAIVPDRAAPVVATCADGVQSTLAAATLREMGYTAARVLAGGIQAWVRAGQPVESGPGRMADEPDDVVLKPYDRGRSAMDAYLRWEEALDSEGRSPHALLPEASDAPRRA